MDAAGKSAQGAVDVARHKEVVLKVCVQPWIDEVFVITTSIEEKLVQMQGTQEQV